MGLFSIFSLPKDQPIIKDKKVIKREYLYWRLRVFMGMYVGYALYYFTRKSFSFLVPALKADLGFTTSQMGLVASVLPVVYGISKFVSGVLGDRLNPRAIMGVGLLLTGVFNLLFGMSSSIAVFMVFWGLMAGSRVLGGLLAHVFLPIGIRSLKGDVGGAFGIRHIM